jgi:hypothetical protein
MKSNASDQLELLEAIYIDATNKCTASVSDLRDLETIRSRVEKEGLSFLTITLPNFCRDFERSLAVGYIDSTLFRSFRKNGSIPAFLQGMISLIFDRETGRKINDEQTPNGVVVDDFSTLIDSIRQICLSFKKLEIGCTLQRVHSAIHNYVEVEQSLQEFSLSESEIADFTVVSGVLWDVLVSPIRLADCNPRHGPGATAERISGNQKYVWRNWHDRLEPYFPLIGTGYPLGTSPDSEELEMVTIIPTDDEQPVRVVPVPKTLKGPRIIAIEPCCMQFAQQGIRSALYERIESYWLTRGHVNFRDQTVNQKLAIISSKTGQLATIDLSDASDRVPRDLALVMFRSNPDLQAAIDACRSTKAELPDGSIIGPLKKFASMGSALCFPIEAMYFYTICVVALLRAQNLPVTRRNCFTVSRELYVYGDDIIVPTTYAAVVLDYLRKYNCKVNTHKTFTEGNFRESCGVDAYRGVEVTPTYLRTLRPENKRQPERIVSWVATANLFYLKGYWHAATFMFKQCERIVGPLPYVSDTSPGLGRISFLGYQSAGRWNDNFHRFEIKALVPSPVYRTDRLESYGALSKSLQALELKTSNVPSSTDEGSFLTWFREKHGMAMREGSGLEVRFTSNTSGILSEVFSRDPLHLERFALHGAVVLKRRWVPTT